MITLRCQNCRQAYHVDELRVGSPIRCQNPECEHTIDIVLPPPPLYGSPPETLRTRATQRELDKQAEELEELALWAQWARHDPWWAEQLRQKLQERWWAPLAPVLSIVGFLGSWALAFAMVLLGPVETESRSWTELVRLMLALGLMVQGIAAGIALGGTQRLSWRRVWHHLAGA